MHESRNTWPSQEILDPISVTHTETPQAPNDELNPAKQALHRRRPPGTRRSAEQQPPNANARWPPKDHTKECYVINEYLTNFPSQNMTQGHFIVGNHARIETNAWLFQKMLGPSVFPILVLLTRQVINKSERPVLAWGKPPTPAWNQWFSLITLI